MTTQSQLRLDVWSDYVCPFCYLEVPFIDRLREEFGPGLQVYWHAFELRPEPVPTLDPDGEYLHRVWNQSVYPMAAKGDDVEASSGPAEEPKSFRVGGICAGERPL